MLKISKSGAEPAARGARMKRPPPHNAAPPPARPPLPPPPMPPRGRLRSPRRAQKARSAAFKRRGRPCRRRPRPWPAASGRMRRNRRLRTASRAQENAPAGAKAAPKRAASASVARPRLGPAGRRLKRWLARHFDSAQLEAVRPLAEELLSLADSLHEVRCELSSGALATSERVKLRRLETQLSASFGRTWRLLGLAEDTPVTMPRGRPAATGVSATNWSKWQCPD
jgi:hypothetical protein